MKTTIAVLASLLRVLWTATVSTVDALWKAVVVTVKFLPRVFTPIYANALILMGILGVWLIDQIMSAPESAHVTVFNFTVAYSLGSVSMALVFAKRSAGGDRISLNTIGLVSYALGAGAILNRYVDVWALVKTVEPDQLHETYGIGLIAAVLTVAAAFANASKD